MATTASPVQQLLRETPLLPNPSPVQQLLRETPLLPNPSPVQQLIHGTPIPALGIRGPQIEPGDLALDRLINIPSNSLSITAGIDLTALGTTTIFTATQKTYLLGVLLQITTASSVTTFANVSIGINPSINNIFTDEPLVAFDAVGEIYTFWNNLNTAVILNTSDVLQVSVNTAASAVGLVANAYVIGILL